MAESRAETVGRVMANSPAEPQSRREAAPLGKEARELEKAILG